MSLSKLCVIMNDHVKTEHKMTHQNNVQTYPKFGAPTHFWWEKPYKGTWRLDENVFTSKKKVKKGHCTQLRRYEYDTCFRCGTIDKIHKYFFEQLKIFIGDFLLINLNFLLIFWAAALSSSASSRQNLQLHAHLKTAWRWRLNWVLYWSNEIMVGTAGTTLDVSRFFREFDKNSVVIVVLCGFRSF